MKPLNRLIVVILILISNLNLKSQSLLCDPENEYLNHYEYSIPSFIQLYTGGYCVSGDISDTTLYFRFYPDNLNGVIYWGYSSPLGYNLDVTSISILDVNCNIISQGQSVNGLDNSLYYVKFDLRTTYIDNFCPYFLPINPLAVNFGPIKIKQVENSIVIDWVTLSETNSDYFIIQYSYDLNIWKSTNKIYSSTNSSTNRYYTTFFTPQYSGTVYIRIMEYDKNGDFILSDINYITYIPKSDPKMLIYDLSGRVIGVK